MRKNKEVKINRIQFIKMTIEQPKEAKKFFEDKIKKLDKVKNHEEAIQILKETLFLSDQTIYKDYYS